VLKLIMDGEHPGRVPDRVVEELRSRERNGLVELPTRPAFLRGDRVRITRGALQGQIAIFKDMRPRERVAVLLAFLGGERRLELARRDVLRVT
jgi:transcription antitermination factor NusG